MTSSEKDLFNNYSLSFTKKPVKNIPQIKIDNESESPVFDAAGGGGNLRMPSELPNEISAPYEVPQFPIEQIEKKLLIQRQLTVKIIEIN
ncbi:hypothetical protein KQX54_003083 [Cotesia glomerata]|uniref:Uncharacterized protein n=1 Tax=Cotesia glomerata TaxID=32391 RepID=A0AAV7J3N7_COTGL|nr:hypothetical protein KQX54_003083 [Cotesia glomerata]